MVVVHTGMTEDDQRRIKTLAEEFFEKQPSISIGHALPKDFDYKYLADFLCLLWREETRSMVIMAFEFLHDVLSFAFTTNLNKDVPGGLKNLVSSQGPLETARAKILMAYALNWISEDAFRDLELIRKMRNEFAHNIRITSFSDSKIQGLLSSLSKRDHFIPESMQYADPKSMFYRRFSLLCMMVVLEALTSPQRGGPPFPCMAEIPPSYSGLKPENRLVVEICLAAATRLLR